MTAMYSSVILWLILHILTYVKNGTVSNRVQTSRCDDHKQKILCTNFAKIWTKHAFTKTRMPWTRTEQNRAPHVWNVCSLLVSINSSLQISILSVLCPFVSQRSTDDRWPQLTASNNYQCVGKPSNRGSGLVNQNAETDWSMSPTVVSLGLGLMHAGHVLVSWIYSLT